MKTTLLINHNLSKLLILVLVITQSCTSIKLISEYDEITDNTVNQLQKNITNYFVKLERQIGTENAEYNNYTNFFDEIKVSLNTLQIRAAAIEKNRIVQEQIGELEKMINNLEELHKIGFISFNQIAPIKRSFNIAFTAIIKLQLALKRGG